MTKTSYQKIKEARDRFAEELVDRWYDGGHEGVSEVESEAFKVVGKTCPLEEEGAYE